VRNPAPVRWLGKVVGVGRSRLEASRSSRAPVIVSRLLFVLIMVVTLLPVQVFAGSDQVKAAWGLSSIASALLVVGLFLMVELQFRSLSRRETSLAHRTESYSRIIETYFTQWKLSPSERAVAVYVMKGFSNAEIASFRQTSEATIKTQLNAIYRKAGVSSRQQLACFIFEDFVQLRPEGILDPASIPGPLGARERTARIG